MGNKIIDTGFDPNAHPQGEAWFEVRNCISNFERNLEFFLEKLKKQTAEKQEICDCPENQLKKMMVENIFFKEPALEGVESLKIVYVGKRCFLCKKEFIEERVSLKSCSCFACGGKIKINHTKNYSYLSHYA